jgi:hypothetical protein
MPDLEAEIAAVAKLIDDLKKSQKATEELVKATIAKVDAVIVRIDALINRIKKHENN